MNPSPFRIGDRVRVKRGNKGTGGAKGVVADVFAGPPEQFLVPGEQQVKVEAATGRTWWYAASEIEHDPDTQEPPK